jgi:sugar/nucleoside kinase (ribokinase family)
MSPQPILVVGSVALDDIETGAGRRPECLGGSATYFSTAASHFAPVHLVGVVGSDFPEQHLDLLRRRGVDLEGLERVSGRTFRWRGRYTSDLTHRETLDTQLNVFERFEPKIPPRYRSLPVLFLGNIHPTLQVSVLDQVATPRLVVADTMNFWITGERAALMRVLGRVDALIINDEEARLLADEANVFRAADHIRALGPKILVIKRGEHGALLFHPDGIFFAPALPLRDVVDPTGAGDTFAGGFVGHLARVGSTDFAAVRAATLYGTVMASFTVQGFSLDRLESASEEAIGERVETLRALMRTS